MSDTLANVVDMGDGLLPAAVGSSQAVGRAVAKQSFGRTLTMHAMTADDIRNELISACSTRGAASEIARKAGLPRSTISDVISGRRSVSASIANALGYMSPAFFISVRKDANK